MKKTNLRILLVFLLVTAVLAGCGKGTKPPKTGASAVDEHIYFYQMAISLYRDGKTEDAATNYKEAIRISPSHAESHYGLGLCYLDMEQYQNAIKAFNSALTFRPEYSDALLGTGVAHDRINQSEKALEYLKQAAESRSAIVTATANYNIGLIQLRQKDYERAYYSFKKASTDYPGYVDAYAKAAEALEGMGKIRDALQNYLEALKQTPDSPEYLYKIAHLYFGLGEKAKAREYFEKIIAVAPNSEYGERAINFLKNF